MTPGDCINENHCAVDSAVGDARLRVAITGGDQNRGAGQAIADCGRVDTRVFGEVENALSSGFAPDDRAMILARVMADNERVLELAQVRYRVGSGDLRAVNPQQLALYWARSAHIRVEAERRVQRVSLYLALGGGFESSREVLPPTAARSP